MSSVSDKTTSGKQVSDKTVSDKPTHRAPLPTDRGRRTRTAIDAAARTVIARKGFLATTIADIASEADRSTASFYNYYDSKEAMIREWALRFRDEVGERAKPVTRHGLSTRERTHQFAAAHWHTYKHRLAEMISVSQLAMINDDFAQHWSEICDYPNFIHHRDGATGPGGRLLRGRRPAVDGGGDRRDAESVLLPAIDQSDVGR